MLRRGQSVTARYRIELFKGLPERRNVRPGSASRPVGKFADKAQEATFSYVYPLT